MTMHATTMRTFARALRPAAVALLVAAMPAPAQDRLPPPPQGPIASNTYATSYIRLGLRNAEALFYTPTATRAANGVAVLYIHPNGNTFTEPAGPQLAARGFAALMINARGEGADRDDAFGPAISQGIRFLRGLDGVHKVVVIGHSGGGHLTAWYTNVALNGPDACAGPGKIYPCDRALASNLQKPDGLVLLDPTLGTFHQANSIDPAIGTAQRIAALDMFSAAHGFDAKAGKAAYTPAFIAHFNAAQAARSRHLTTRARARLRLIDAGKGRFRDDEPMVIPGMGNQSAGARLFQPDTSLLHHTRGNYVTLQADGTRTTGPIVSVRPPLAGDTPANLDTLGLMTRNTTVRQYLATSAIRFGPGYAITADNIRGVDWTSAAYSTPGNARGITVPILMLTMSCHYLVVPDEIIFENLASSDKTLMGVAGATHLFQPCRPEYGDTMKRTFDAVAEWLGKPGRF